MDFIVKTFKVDNIKTIEKVENIQKSGSAWGRSVALIQTGESLEMKQLTGFGKVLMGIARFLHLDQKLSGRLFGSQLQFDEATIALRELKLKLSPKPPDPEQAKKITQIFSENGTQAPLPSLLEPFIKEWEGNRGVQGGEGLNYEVLSALISDSKINNEDLSSFMRKVEVRPKGGWLETRDGSPTDLKVLLGEKRPDLYEVIYEKKPEAVLPQSVQIRRKPNLVPIASVTPKGLKEVHISESVQEGFKKVYSNALLSLKGILNREGFIEAVKEGKWEREPVVVSKSDFVSKEMAEHLMIYKKDGAIGVKYAKGDKITNMEGALHTFVTPICPITMTGDYAYKGSHTVLPLGKDQGRQVILSAAIHPDFENSGSSEVVMRIVEVLKEAQSGEALAQDYKPLSDQVGEDKVKFNEKLEAYEESLQKHMIHHLTKAHRLPAKDEVTELSFEEAKKYIEGLVKGKAPVADSLEDQCVKLNGHVISLEALFNLYVHQIRNEFSVLEATLPQGYVYTMDPPKIFAGQLGGKGVEILNRIQILALKHVSEGGSLKNLKMIGFNDFADSGGVALLKNVFPDKSVMAKKELFKEGGRYSVREGYALVLHNNSDAFGQNIETESSGGSMDGAIGANSSAAASLMRDKEVIKTVV